MLVGAPAMESDPDSDPDQDPALLPCCACPASSSSSPVWRRSSKRKLDEVAPGDGILRSASMPGGGGGGDVLARVEVENECVMLRETVTRQQDAIQGLYEELDEERSAASSAANEAMSMILRLQREKAEIQMEARQFKRFAEEKMAHDQFELAALEDAVYKREQAIQALSYQLQAYKHRLLCHGIDPESINKGAEDSGSPGGTPAVYYYPHLRCNIPEIGDLEKHVAGSDGGDTSGRLRDIEQRIYEMEGSPSSSSHTIVLEKGVLVGNSPRFSRHSHKISVESLGSILSGKRSEEFPVMIDRASDEDGDDTSDRVYTIDAVHGTTADRVHNGFPSAQDDDIKKLYMRLQALEADRESLKQEIISMRTESAQLVLLREIAQNLSKGVGQHVPAATPRPERRLVKRQSLLQNFSLVNMLKWVVSLVFWRNKPGRTRYSFGRSKSNVGLLLLLDKSPRLQQLRCLTRAQS